MLTTAVSNQQHDVKLPKTATEIEIGDVQMSLNRLNSLIEEACENQRAIEVRFDAVLLMPGDPADGGSAQDPTQRCELSQTIQRMICKVQYLKQRQVQILQGAQL